jgi:hypothetical protein
MTNQDVISGSDFSGSISSAALRRSPASGVPSVPNQTHHANPEDAASSFTMTTAMEERFPPNDEPSTGLPDVEMDADGACPDLNVSRWRETHASMTTPRELHRRNNQKGTSSNIAGGHPHVRDR